MTQSLWTVYSLTLKYSSVAVQALYLQLELPPSLVAQLRTLRLEVLLLLMGITLSLVDMGMTFQSAVMGKIPHPIVIKLSMVFLYQQTPHHQPLIL